MAYTKVLTVYMQQTMSFILYIIPELLLQRLVKVYKWDWINNMGIVKYIKCIYLLVKSIFVTSIS